MEKYTEQQIEYFKYLEELRKSGETNMFGAAPYLAKEFGIDKRTAQNILAEWMENYDEILELIAAK